MQPPFFPSYLVFPDEGEQKLQVVAPEELNKLLDRVVKPELDKLSSCIVQVLLVYLQTLD